MTNPRVFRPIRWLTHSQSGNLVLLIGTLAFLIAVPLLAHQYQNHGWVLILRLLQPIFIASFVMWLQLGSPLNWWRPFFGVIIEADLTKIALREQAGERAEDIQNELRDWVEQMSKSRYFRLNSYAFKFLRKRDAAMFKLVWG